MCDMHGSDTSDKQFPGIRLYLDESGGPDPNTPHAVVGGILINHSHLLHFEEAWRQMLKMHRIIPPLHMKEFGSHGRFAHVSHGCRRQLFMAVAQVINSHKIASLAATLSNEEYEANISAQIREKFSVYGMCFILAVVMNHKLALHKSYCGSVSFILDSGNPYKRHIVEAHAAMLDEQKNEFLNVGGLHFEDDEDLGILQAADVVAWGVRRRATGKPFEYAFQPIGEILKKENGHGEADLKGHWMKDISEATMAQYLEAKAQTR